jgi:MerR family copper efflux transcriptional regulator
MGDRISVGELAKLAGIRASALRYYEEAGLLAPADRAQNGYRSYPPEAIGRIRFIQRAKSLGLSLHDIRTLVAGAQPEGVADRDRLRHAVAHRLEETKRRIAELHELERELESMYVRLLRFEGPECGHLGDCECWLPTEEEVKIMRREVACCGELCCPGCSCGDGEACDCPDCPCCEGADANKTKQDVEVRGRAVTRPVASAVAQ